MTSSFDTCRAILTDGDSPRVWSLLVTIFGDMAQGDGQTLTTPELTSLTAKLGIRPEATRVALHRLKRDDWLWSERSGRGSRFGLTKNGRALTLEASPRIYGHGPLDKDWYLLVADPATHEHLSPRIRSGEVYPVAPGIGLTMAPNANSDPTVLCVSGGNGCPLWMSEAICPPELQEASANLLRRFQQVSQAFPHHLDADEAIALRILTVHEWRRVILRAPHLPDVLFPDGWTGNACRAGLHELLQKIARYTQPA